VAVLNGGAKLELTAGAANEFPDILLKLVKSKSGRQRWTRGQQFAYHLRNLDLFGQITIKIASLRLPP